MSKTIIDAHLHLLQNDRDYPWMVDEATQSLKQHSLAELDHEFAACGVAAGIVVQAMSDPTETCELLRIAKRSSILCGVIGWVDLTSSSIDDDLTALREGDGGEMLVGIRHQTHDEADPTWLLRTDVLRGLERVAAATIPFDLLIRSREIPAALRLAATLPELKLVVDHMAKPIVDRAMHGAWREAMMALAGFPNVFCKLSGLTTEVTPLGSWTPTRLEMFLSTAIEVFGAARCMFGSDWPVSRLAATYSGVVDLTIGALAALPVSEREAVLAVNAISIYHLNANLSRHDVSPQWPQSQHRAEEAEESNVDDDERG